ncbi:RNA polymerase sigma-G factor [Clostridium botulinum]|uniref:Imm41 family immunity protein n=1 Tax=Clostridium botulinum TaxID=1491 RepID=UPI0006A72262|nr:Imm41 family immunity protein [Clostridium botulinum]KOM98505.1 RNA polymerase sigma-G factor [Clostridium botulinum]KON00246.1 RNA polymerase sigma-G factor [Clostridium botulinum]MBY7003019.1 RNA polymerase subunit sigma [Clostridium botulinum]MCR1146512.1 immunity 41 family protein [Clostridium botulinum]NFH92606.1 RNA polymerase subunit sigma [Clostridium botulinum]
MKNSLEILNSNYKSEEGSFIYSLHERNHFNKDLYWEYYNAILNITESSLNKPLDKEISKMIFDTYNYFLKSIIWHLSTNDLSKIDNFPSEGINLYVERLSVRISSGYFEKRHIDECIFDEELQNPYYKAD